MGLRAACPQGRLRRLAHGIRRRQLLQTLVETGPVLDAQEKRTIVQQCAEALVYMESFGVVHRDFRGCNIFLRGRGEGCRVGVIDLGFMVSDTKDNVKNPNLAVRCAWQGDGAKETRFDWAPPEVRSAKSPNFALPGCSFDVFSFGVLILKMMKGRPWTREVLAQQAPLSVLLPFKSDIEDIGLQADVLAKVLDHDRPDLRPLPNQLLEVVMAAGKRGTVRKAAEDVAAVRATKQAKQAARGVPRTSA